MLSDSLVMRDTWPREASGRGCCLVATRVARLRLCALNVSPPTIRRKHDGRQMVVQVTDSAQSSLITYCFATSTGCVAPLRQEVRTSGHLRGMSPLGSGSTFALASAA